MCSISSFHIFFWSKTCQFFVSLYKEPLEVTCKKFLACLIVLNSLCEVFGCSIITDFMSTKLGFWKKIDSWVISISNYWQCSSALWGRGVFSVNSVPSNCRSLISDVSLNNDVFFRKSNLSIMVFKDKVSDLFDWHLFYSVGNIQDIHGYIRKTKQAKKWS